MDQTIFFLKGMANAGRFTSMMDVLSSIDHPTAKDMDSIMEAYHRDLTSYLKNMKKNSYSKTLCKVLLFDQNIEKLFRMDLTHNTSVSMTTSHFASYINLRYNQILNRVLLDVCNKQPIDPGLSKIIVSLWAIYNLFVKGVIGNGDDKALGKSLSIHDDNFPMIYSTAGGMILYHLRDAVVHGRIVFGDDRLFFIDIDSHHEDKITYAGAVKYRNLVDGLIKSIPGILPNLENEDRITYIDVMNFLQRYPSNGGLKTNREIACLTLLSNFNRYFENDLAFYREYCHYRDKGFHFHSIGILGNMSAKNVRNAFAHNIRFKNNILYLDGSKKMNFQQFMAYNDALKILDDILILKCISGSKDFHILQKQSNT